MSDLPVAPKETTTKVKAKLHRSKAYPILDLEASLNKLRIIYDQEKRHWLSAQVAMKHLGFSKTDGFAGRVLAALGHYGLLDSKGVGDSRQVRISDLGYNILIDQRPDSDDRKQALREAALSPQFFRELWDAHSSDGLPSDVNLRHELLKQESVNPNVVDSFIKTFRATLDFAGLEDASNPPDSGIDRKVNGEHTPPNPPIETNLKAKLAQALPAGVTTGQSYYDVAVPLKGSAPALLHIPMPLTRENYNHMIRMLEKQFDLVKDMENVIVEEPTIDVATP